MFACQSFGLRFPWQWRPAGGGGARRPLHWASTWAHQLWVIPMGGDVLASTCCLPGCLPLAAPPVLRTWGLPSSPVSSAPVDGKKSVVYMMVVKERVKLTPPPTPHPVFFCIAANLTKLGCTTCTVGRKQNIRQTNKNPVRWDRKVKGRCSSNLLRETCTLGLVLGWGMGSVSIVFCESADRKRWRGCDGDFSPGCLYLAGAWNLCVSVYCENRRTLSLLLSFSLLEGVATAVSGAPVQA